VNKKKIWFWFSGLLLSAMILYTIFKVIIPAIESIGVENAIIDMGVIMGV